MKFFPMARASGLGSLPSLLEKRSGTRDLLRSFQQFDVPLEITDNPKAYIPLCSMRGLFDHSAHLLGERCFGLEVGLEMSPKTFGKWLVFSAQARTLDQAFRRVESTCHHQVTGARMYLDRRPLVSFWRFIAPSSKDCSRHHTDHLIGPMINFIRGKLGSEWNPEWVDVDYPRDVQCHLVEDMLAVPVHFNAQSLAIAIRTDEIGMAPKSRTSIASHPVITAFDVMADRLIESPDETINSIFLVMSLRLIEGLTDIDGTARIVGLSLQQLQRTLRREGTCYRDLLERAKLVRAQSMLKETELTVTEISLSLGYADNTGFSRAFRKMAGSAPIQYRKNIGSSP